MAHTTGVDPHAAKLGVRLTLIVVSVILVAIPFGILLLEVAVRAILPLVW